MQNTSPINGKLLFAKIPEVLRTSQVAATIFSKFSQLHEQQFRTPVSWSNATGKSQSMLGLTSERENAPHSPRFHCRSYIAFGDVYRGLHHAETTWKNVSEQVLVRRLTDELIIAEGRSDRLYHTHILASYTGRWGFLLRSKPIRLLSTVPDLQLFLLHAGSFPTTHRCYVSCTFLPSVHRWDLKGPSSVNKMVAGKLESPRHICKYHSLNDNRGSKSPPSSNYEVWIWCGYMWPRHRFRQTLF